MDFTYTNDHLPAANLSCATVAKDKKELGDKIDSDGSYNQKIAPTT